ncbi:uncharacterized protein B0H18DRAFT_176291 [Fomitopsis serialis]|uniref:uncharacterized protein n=1 Tax=Fomitopsis serialis TaxID=139415 RepID=UPI0020075B5A|nr:uncharacterized protein B0H18DRAFT_176291 [Neoantrodia serialis]KAH9913417.1 hypothetical protein B0H18DRAFT_176291 [Neoantrodia serialis]
MWNEYRLVGSSIPSCRPNAVDDEERSLTTDLSNRIPMEVYENVIEHMDQCTLYSSALVCQAWNPRASYLLYLTILITSRASYDLLVKQLRTSPRVQRWLQSTRQVALGEHWTDSVTPFLDAFPLVFGHACPALQGLNIGYVLRPNMHPTFHVALRQLQHLVSLRLHHVDLSNSTQLRRIVCAFPCLKELALDAVLLLHPQLPQSAGGRPQNDPSRGSCNIRLKRLQVVSDTDKHVQTFGRTADWLISSGICSSLAELVTAFYGTHTELAIEHVNRLLETMGQSLTSFYCHSDLNLLRE